MSGEVLALISKAYEKASRILSQSLYKIKVKDKGEFTFAFE